MRLPSVEGVIRRRILVNFRVDPEVMRTQIPARFTPKLHAGKAIAGICLIRLEEIRPRSLPSFVGLASENAAHRVAVRWWGCDGEEKQGVFIPRRDTSSAMNMFAGGKLFPGEHHLAAFEVDCSGEGIRLEMESSDGQVAVRIRGKPADALPATSSFASVAEASAFFEPGSLGYSATSDPSRLDGVMLKTKTWKVEPLAIEEVYSSYFSDELKFPKGSVDFDCALLMRNIAHEWHGAGDLYV